MERTHAKRGGLGCGGCLLVLVGLWLLSRAQGWWEEHQEDRAAEAAREAAEEERRAQDAQRAELEKEIVAFTLEHAPALQRALEEVDRQVARHEERLRELEATFRTLDREPTEDADYRRWKAELAELRSESDDLRRKREDAFLLWKKYLISRNPEEEQRFRDSVRSGQEAAEATQRRLSELLEEQR